MKNSLILIGLLFLFICCNSDKDWKLATIKTETGWGYTISNQDKIVIKQTIIPVISKIKSFETEAEAAKTGNLVLQKLRNNISPTITKKELTLLAIKL